MSESRGTPPECSCGYPKERCLYGNAEECKQLALHRARKDEQSFRSAEVKTDPLPLLEANEAVVDEYVNSYEAVTEDEEGREGIHQPTEDERYLIQDAIAGLLADEDFVRTFNAWQDVARARSNPSATLPIKYVVRCGGECPQDWLCADIPEVQAALCEALYGTPKDACPEAIGWYLGAVQSMTPEELKREWRFEDGWLEVIKLRRPDSGAIHG